MNYLQWNEHISNHFFKPVNAGKDILFYLTQQDLIKFTRQYFNGATDEDIWNDFLNAIKYDDQKKSNLIKPYSPITRPLQLYANWNRVDTPPFIGYLILYIIPLTETYDEHFNTTNYYGKVNLFFKRYEILNQFTENCIGTGNYQNISNLWNELEEWAVITKNCDLGIFELRKFGNPNWIHVGKPFSQCVLPPSAINRLPELYFEAGLIPDSHYSQEEYRKILLRYGSKILGLKESVTELIKRSETNELGQSIIEIVKREYNKWTGETHQEEEEGVIYRTKRNYTVAPLFLQFKLNYNDGQIFFSYRIHSSNEFPEDLKFDTFEILYEINGWSKTLNINFKESLELPDRFNKWIARFPDREVRLFISAGIFQLSSDYWIESESLSKTDPMFLLCKAEKKQSILEWSKTFRNGDFLEEEFEGLPANYSLFRILNPTTSHPDISLLTLYFEKKIELIGGLKVNFRTFINDFLPEIEIINSDGTEKLFLQYKITGDKYYLQKKRSTNNKWLLPNDILLNVDFYIKIEGASLMGNEIAYNIISSNDSAQKVDGLQLPKRDSFGRLANIDLKQYCLGSNIVNPSKASQRYYSAWENFFITTNEDITDHITFAKYNNDCGNMLSSFLTLKNVLTTEEFYRAFEFYYSKEFGESQSSLNINLTSTKKAALNFYDYIGFLDYDYETKIIVVNSSQFIFIPSIKGRKVMLIGGRDSTLINAITTIAPKYNLQVEIIKQLSSNERLLLPDIITIKAFGKRSEGFGERNFNSLANELNIKFSQNDFIQLALKLFSAEISQYENDLLSYNETSQDDYDWARRIFNPDTLSFERNELPTFDKSFSLIEYKLNEYTYYYKLWKNSSCYSVDKNWGKFIALKQFNKHIILFDGKHNKVAIPCETPLPRLLSESIMLLSGLAPDFRNISGKLYRVYENIPGIFTENLFHKLGQNPNNRDLL